ncbi:MAG: hypothetical protein WCP39_01000 [Chlamydiota bacterium]
MTTPALLQSTALAILQNEKGLVLQDTKENLTPFLDHLSPLKQGEMIELTFKFRMNIKTNPSYKTYYSKETYVPKSHLIRDNKFYLLNSFIKETGASKICQVAIDLFSIKKMAALIEREPRSLALEIEKRNAIQQACEKHNKSCNPTERIPSLCFAAPKTCKEILIDPFFEINADNLLLLPQNKPYLPSIITSLLKNLVYMGKIKIIHCDIKLQNILIQMTSGPKPKAQVALIDWESSYFHHEKFKKNKVQGTFTYMSPEILKALNFSSSISLADVNTPGRDVWALGLSLAFLCHYLNPSLLPRTFCLKINDLLTIMKENESKGSLCLTLALSTFYKNPKWINDSDCLPVSSSSSTTIPTSLSKKDLETTHHDISWLLRYMLHPDPAQRITPSEIENAIPYTLLNGQLLIPKTLLENYKDLAYISPEWIFTNTANSNQYQAWCQETVAKHHQSLDVVRPEWVLANPTLYHVLCQGAVAKDHEALEFVRTDWILAHPDLYQNLCLEAVARSYEAIKGIRPEWILTCPDLYQNLCLGAVTKNYEALAFIRPDWTLTHPDLYQNLCLGAVTKDHEALGYIRPEWILAHPALYQATSQRAATINPKALWYCQHEWFLAHPDLYQALCQETVTRNFKTLEFVRPEWILAHPDLYQALCQEAFFKNFEALSCVNTEWCLAHPNLVQDLINSRPK